MPYGPRLEEFLAERRAHGIHGDEAARMLTDPRKYELPETSDDMDELMFLAVERGAFPARLGQIGGVYFDVTMGWRTVAAAVELLERESTPATAPAQYCAHLAGLAIRLGRIGRAADGLVLARLVLAATETAYGEETPEWIDAGCAFVQAGLLRSDPSDPLLGEIEPVVDRLLQNAQVVGAKRDLERVLALAGHYFWTKGTPDDEPYDVASLERAESSLERAADLRRGPERGRTLASLAQVQADLLRQGIGAPEKLVETAQEAIDLVDRDDRPRQWLSARRILRELAPSSAPNDSASAEALFEIRDRHGEVEAQDCLFLEAQDLQARKMYADAQSILEALWEPLHVPRGENEVVHERLLKLAAHTAGWGRDRLSRA